MNRLLANSVAALVLATAVGLSGAAHATEGWYGKAEAGYSFDGELDVDGVGDTELDEGWLGGVGLGYAFGGESSTGFRMEGEATYRDNEVEGFDDNVTSWAGMLNGYLDFNRQGTWQPYIGAGVGYANVEDDGVGLSEEGIAYQGMAGLGIRLGPQGTLDIGYKYFTVPDLDAGGFDVSYVQQAATVGLRWQFSAPAPIAVAPPPQAPPSQPAPVAQVCPTNDFKVYFEWDRSNLNGEGVQTINDAAERARACNVSTVRVIGHTDTSGSTAYNVGLSNRRASVVRDALVAAGIPGASIITEGAGESQLDKATGDGVREPLNRRTAVTISFQ